MLRIEPLHGKCWQSSLEAAPLPKAKPPLAFQDSSLISLQRKPDKSEPSLFGSLWEIALTWMGLNFQSSSEKFLFKIHEFEALSPLRRLVVFRDMIEDKETPKEEILTAFSLLESEDRSAILENIWWIERAEEISDPKAKPDLFFAETFFEKHLHHNSVLVAIRARILASSALPS